MKILSFLWDIVVFVLFCLANIGFMFAPLLIAIMTNNPDLIPLTAVTIVIGLIYME
jgi:hypothetical protein